MVHATGLLGSYRTPPCGAEVLLVGITGTPGQVGMLHGCCCRMLRETLPGAARIPCWRSVAAGSTPPEPARIATMHTGQYRRPRCHSLDSACPLTLPCSALRFRFNTCQAYLAWPSPWAWLVLLGRWACFVAAARRLLQGLGAWQQARVAPQRSLAPARAVHPAC